MLTLDSKIKEVYASPVGHDIIGKLLMQMGKSDALITNPLVGNLKLGTVAKLVKKQLSADFFTTFLHLLNTETAIPGDGSLPVTPAWWKEAVFYQIYPRSFRDTNGDGIGDLHGILEKLDYLQELGVNALWLSPVYDSPNDDNGYDIRNYEKIMTEFGTMEDFDELLSQIHARGMRLIMDLVVNHTSDEHPWFQEALRDKNSKYRNYYYFREGGKEAPNNWTSFFSGSAWKHFEAEDVWALHLFSKKQMDLNWDNPDVRTDIYDMVNRWLDKGVDGFRLDVINYISKENGLPMGDTTIGQMMGFTGIEHYFYGPHLHDYLHELHERCFAPHQAFSVGETPGLGLQMCRLVTGEERRELDMVFSFDHLETPGHVRYDDYRYDLNYFRDYMILWLNHFGNNCRMSLFYNNHDNPRMISKINPDPSMRLPLARLLAVMQFTLPGTPFVFQGDEMGLVNYSFSSMEEITDVEAKGLYSELLQTMSPEAAFAKILCGTREHCRVLLPWEDRVQTQKPDRSITAFYRDMIALRKENDALIYGGFTVLNKKKNRFTYLRSGKNANYLIDCNLGIQPVSAYDVPAGYRPVRESETKQMLGAYEAVIWVKQAK